MSTYLRLCANFHSSVSESLLIKHQVMRGWVGVGEGSGRGERGVVGGRGEWQGEGSDNGGPRKHQQVAMETIRPQSLMLT